MRRIGLFLGVEPHAGGMFQYTQSLLDALQALPAHQYELRIACASEAWRPVLVARGMQPVLLRHAPLGQRLANIWMALRLPVWLTRVLSLFNPLAPQMRAQGCDIWLFPAQDAVAYQLGMPFIASIHDLMHRYEPHFPEVAGRWRTAAREHRFYHLTTQAQLLLTDSEVGKTHVAESYPVPSEKIFALPYVAPSHMAQAVEPADFAERYALPKKFFFYPAQFWAHKNHVALLQAMAQLLPQCPDMQCVFTGGHRYDYPALRAQVGALKLESHVHFPGYVPEAYMPGFYRRARALLMPTFFGPTNIPPLEAMACGCPMAVSGIYAMPEQLGDAAVYFNPRNVDEIASVMQRLWLDDECILQLKEQGKIQLQRWGQAQFNSRLQVILEQLPHD